jgi:Domain of unknown function (DUF4329)
MRSVPSAAYVGYDPVNFVDPTGNFVAPLVAVALIAFGSAAGVAVLIPTLNWLTTGDFSYDWSKDTWERVGIMGAAIGAGVGCGVLGGPIAAGMCAGFVGGALGAVEAGRDASAIIGYGMLGMLTGALVGGFGQAAGSVALNGTNSYYGLVFARSAATTGASLGLQAAMGGEIDWAKVGVQGGVAALLGIIEAGELSAQGEATGRASGMAAARGLEPLRPQKPGFPTAWEAARDALQREIPGSVAANKERGGLIYREGGRYFATAAQTGTDAIVEVWDAQANVPQGATIVGDYHTHPATIDSPAWWLNGETFSGYGGKMYVDPNYEKYLGPTVMNKTDIYGAILDMTTRSGIDPRVFASFMSTPSGRFGIHNVMSGSLFYFSPDPRLLSSDPEWSSLARP